MTEHLRTKWLASRGIIATLLLAVVVLGVGWRHTDSEVRKDQHSWCTLLGDIQAPRHSQPTSPYGKRINDAAHDQYRKFGCRG